MLGRARLEMRGVLCLSAVAGGLGASAALAQAPDDVPPAAAAAPDEEGEEAPAAALAPLAAPDEPALVYSGGRELVVGDVVDGWTISAFKSARRLPDGRPTQEDCGWVRDVVVSRRMPDGRFALKTGLIQVPCERTEGGLVAGEVRLRIEGDPGAAAAPASAAAPDEGALGEPAAEDAAFSPVDPVTITEPARLVDGAKAHEGPKDEGGKALTGVVMLELSVDRTGKVRRARVAGPSAGDVLDKLAVQKAKALRFEPARVKDKAVDVVMPFELLFTDGPPPVEGVILNDRWDWFTLDGPAYKGELSHLGTIQLQNPLNSVGVGFGGAYIDDKAYLSVRPNIDFHYQKFHIGLGTPLRFQLFDTAPVVERLQENIVFAAEGETYQRGLVGVGTFRFEDWDRFIAWPFSDVLRPLRYVTWGRKEDNIFASLNRVNPITIGHGQLVRRYMPNVDIDESWMFGEVDAYWHVGGVELMLGPLPIPRMLSGLVFVKPLGLFFDNYLARSWSIGLSYATDLNTPTQLVTTYDDRLERPQYAIDNGRFLYANRDNFVGWQTQGFGIDSELKVVKWRFLDIKVYADYSHLLFPGVPEAEIAPFMGGGATVGGLIRMSFGKKPVRDEEDEPIEVRKGLAPREYKAVHALRLRGEARVFSPQFLPSYFNSLYEADKFQFGMAQTPDFPDELRATLPTKVAYLADQKNDPFRAGWYLEGSYTLVDWVAVTAVYEDAVKLWGELATVPAARNVMLHIETQGLGWLQLFLTYHYRNFELQNWLRMLNVGSPNELIFAGARLSVLFLALNFGMQRGLRVDQLNTDLASTRTIGNKEYPHSSVGLQNQWAFFFDVELGWNW